MILKVVVSQLISLMNFDVFSFHIYITKDIKKIQETHWKLISKVDHFEFKTTWKLESQHLGYWNESNT
jgi:hypothetical protein